MEKNNRKKITLHSIIHCKYNTPVENFKSQGYMYNAYVKGELYEIDLWTKLRKNQRMNWFSNETIDIKLKVEKTIYYREKIIPKQTSK